MCDKYRLIRTHSVSCKFVDVNFRFYFGKSLSGKNVTKETRVCSTSIVLNYIQPIVFHTILYRAFRVVYKSKIKNCLSIHSRVSLIFKKA